MFCIPGPRLLCPTVDDEEKSFIILTPGVVLVAFPLLKQKKFFYFIF